MLPFHKGERITTTAGGVVASIMPVDLSANRHKGAEVRFFDDNGLSRKLFSLMMREVGGQ